MSSFLTTLLLASSALTATAQITTSIWMPSPYRDETHIGFYASVIGASQGTTTLALTFDNKTDLATAGYVVDSEPNTMTFLGTSSFESVTTTVVEEGGARASVTQAYGCRQTNARGGLSVGAVCTFASEVKGGKAEVNTYEIGREEIATFQVVITAGEEKLESATETSTSTSSASSVTETGAAFTLHRGQNVVPSQTSTAAVEAPQETGAANALLVHPALAGLGAAAVAFLL